MNTLCEDVVHIQRNLHETNPSNFSFHGGQGNHANIREKTSAFPPA
jgi:hypothetical protein